MSKLWHIATKEDIEDTLNTDFERGMTNEFAQSMLAKSRKKVKKEKSAKKNALSYFSTAFAILLVILSVIFMFKGKASHATTIIILVLVSEILGLLMDVLSKKSEKGLKELLKVKVLAIRDGTLTEIYKDRIARGDIIVLKKGDVVPCDGRITYCENLKVLEECVTGIKDEVEKTSDADLLEETELKDRTNMLYDGSVVVSGNCKMVACETGKNTVLAQNQLLKEDKKSYMQIKVREVSIVLTIFTFMLILVLFAVTVLSGADIIESLLICLSAGAVLIPSKLPSVISHLTNKGMLKMAQNGNIVKNGWALERLALCDTVILGKTGVITQKDAKVESIISVEGNLPIEDDTLSVAHKGIIKIILEFAAVCTRKNASYEEQTIDAAVLKAAQNAEAMPDGVEIEKEYPFDMNEKIMTVCAASQNGHRIIIKGDVKKVLDMCDKAVSSTQLEDLTDEIKETLTQQYEEKLKQGYKAIALAYKDSENLPDENVGENFTLLGILVIENKITAQAVDAINQLTKAGIRPVMVSYDDELICKAVAVNCGIISEEEQAVTGNMIDEMSDEELDEKTNTAFVFASLSPLQKERIVESLKRNNKTVCMVSYTSSDEYAMEISDISISKKDGAQVNTINADVVTDGTLSGFVNLIKRTQILYLDARKSIRFALSVAIGLMLYLIFATMLTNKLPLYGIQVLALGIITTSLLAFALPFGTDVDKHKIKSVAENRTVFIKMWPRIIFAGGFSALFAIVLFIKTRYFTMTVSDAESFINAQSTVFVFFVLYQILNVIYLRKNVFTLKEGKKELGKFIATVTFAIIFTTCLMKISTLKVLFGFDGADVFAALIFAVVYVVVKIVQEFFKISPKCNKKAEDLNGTNI